MDSSIELHLFWFLGFTATEEVKRLSRLGNLQYGVSTRQVSDSRPSKQLTRRYTPATTATTAVSTYSTTLPPNIDGHNMLK
jgi:hypothetical protein